MCIGSILEIRGFTQRAVLCEMLPIAQDMVEIMAIVMKDGIMGMQILVLGIDHNTMKQNCMGIRHGQVKIIWKESS